MGTGFSARCFRTALRTFSLDLLQVLRHATRVPDALLADEGSTARPTWIGKDYAPGGVLLLGKNPGGGSSGFATTRPLWDIDFFAAL
jgi:hypothetical protein